MLAFRFCVRILRFSQAKILGFFYASLQRRQEAVRGQNLLRPSDFYIFRGAIIKSQKLFWFLCGEIRKILRKACGVENTALQHLMLLFSLHAPDKVRSRKTGQAALSRYEKARSAKKYRAKRRGSPAACHVFQRKHFIRGWCTAIFSTFFISTERT